MHYSSPAGTIAGVEVVIDWHCKILINLGYPVKLITGTKAKLNYRNLEEVTISSLSPNHSVVQRVQKELLQKHQPTIALSSYDVLTKQPSPQKENTPNYSDIYIIKLHYVILFFLV